MEFIKVNKNRYKVFNKVNYALLGMKLGSGVRRIGTIIFCNIEKEFQFLSVSYISSNNNELFEIIQKIDELNEKYKIKQLRRLENGN